MDFAKTLAWFLARAYITGPHMSSWDVEAAHSATARALTFYSRDMSTPRDTRYLRGDS